MILTERKYVDRDFLTDFSNYYVRCSTDYDRFCKRLHFFKDVCFDKKDFISLLCGNEKAVSTNDLQKNYLGFLVAKPLPEAVFGRTALKTYPSDGGKRQYCCNRKYNVSLYGIPLSINSLAFQEQDTVAAACATSALWSAFHKTSEIFDQSLSPSPIEITKLATKYWFGSRPIPSSGLNIMQMCQAIHEVGLEPHVRVIRNAPDTSPLPIVSFIYSYLKMGIPIILNVDIVGVGLHSITVSGYRIEDKICIRKETVPKAEFYYPLTGLRIKEFYAHDDRIGPFCRIEIREQETIGNDEHPLPVEFKIPATGEILEPYSIIVPLYHKIRVVFLRVYEWIWHLHQAILVSCIIPENVEWDIYLSSLNKFKRELLTDPKYSHMRPMLQLKQLPRYIWRANLTYNNENLMEIIADATDMDRSFFFKRIIFFNNNLKNQINSLVTSRRDALQNLLTVPFTNFLIEQTEN